jgi:nucleoside-specific outer membrane channel protein Tsx
MNMTLYTTRYTKYRLIIFSSIHPSGSTAMALYQQLLRLSQQKTQISYLGSFLILVTALLGSSMAWSGSAQWSSTNFQYLYGTNHELGDETRGIVTLEHVNGWKYGDNFFFIDVTNPDRPGELTPTGYYAEISPRLSFGKIFGKDLSYGIVKDVLFTSTAELGEDFRTYLYGIAVDLTLPKFAFFQVNWYARNQVDAATDLGQQVTLVWGLPFAMGSVDWMFEGFADYAYNLDPAEDNLIAGPRLLVDAGKFWGAPGSLQVGIEYQIWRNKFGIDGIDEDVPQAMVKWIW